MNLKTTTFSNCITTIIFGDHLAKNGIKQSSRPTILALAACLMVLYFILVLNRSFCLHYNETVTLYFPV
jgi:hypothetical protein